MQSSELNESLSHVAYDLLQHLLLDSEPLALWSAIQSACTTVAGATSSELYLFDPEARQLRLLVDRLGESCPLRADSMPLADITRRFSLAAPITARTGYSIAKAVRQKRILHHLGRNGEAKVAVPLGGHPDWHGPPFAVAALRIPTSDPEHLVAVRRSLEQLLAHIWPVCTYATLSSLQQALDSQPDIQTVSASILDILCNKFGFEFATISLVDANRRQIQTMRGKNAPWVKHARHSLDSNDIQANVIRSGCTRVIVGWASDLDPVEFEEYHHESFVRIFIPILSTVGSIGIIEAGFNRSKHNDIHPILRSTLERWTLSNVSPLVQNTILQEQQSNYTIGLSALHDISYKLQTEVQQRTTSEWLQMIANSGREVLNADLIMLYLLDPRTKRLKAPIKSGHIYGKKAILTADDDDNIVHHIANTELPIYTSDVYDNEFLVKSDEFTFTERQGIVSFAGVPLVVRGEVLGVLCANFRSRHEFDERETRVIELYAQQAAAMIVSDTLIREQELKRLEYDLHDLVKSKISGIDLHIQAALASAHEDVVSTTTFLEDARRYCREVLSNINTLLDSLSLIGEEGVSFRDVLQRALERMRVVGKPELQVELSDDLPDVPVIAAAHLVYLIDQAISNARQHAGAQTVKVRLHRAEGHLEIVVEDDGHGFSTEDDGVCILDATHVAVQGHRGLASMYQRAERLGGALTIESRRDRGSTVHVTIPLMETSDGAATDATNSI